MRYIELMFIEEVVIAWQGKAEEKGLAMPDTIVFYKSHSKLAQQF